MGNLKTKASTRGKSTSHGHACNNVSGFRCCDLCCPDRSWESMFARVSADLSAMIFCKRCAWAWAAWSFSSVLSAEERCRDIVAHVSQRACCDVCRMRMVLRHNAHRRRNVASDAGALESFCACQCLYYSYNSMTFV